MANTTHRKLVVHWAQLAQKITVLVVLSASGACSPDSPSGTIGAQSEEQIAIFQKQAFFDRAHADAVAKFVGLATKEVRSGPSGAWYALNLARAGHDFEAATVATRMIKQEPTNAWSEFAMAGYLLWAGQRGPDAIAHAENAYAQHRNDIDFIWLYAESLRLQHRFDESRRVLETDKKLLNSSSQLLVVWASVLYDQVLRDPRAKSLVEKADAAFDRARVIDHSSINAQFTSGWFHWKLGRITEGVKELGAAAATSTSESVHAAYWGAVLDQKDLPYEARKEAILADVEDLLHRRHGDIQCQSIAAEGFRLIQDEKKAQEIERQIVQTSQSSRAADYIEFRSLLGLLRDRSKDTWDNEALLASRQKEMRQDIKEFLQHSVRNPEVTKSALGILFELELSDRTIASSDFLATANALSSYEDVDPRSAYVDVPLGLADRRIGLDRAEELARKGVRIEEARLQVLDRRTQAYRDEYTSAAVYFDALGWVLLQQIKLKEAEVELGRAAQANGFNSNPVFIHHLTQLYLKRGDHINARALIVRCYSASIDPTIECRDDVRDYYALVSPQNRSGVDAFIESFEKEVQVLKRAELARESRDSRELVSSFRLATLDGREWTSDSLRGKLSVIAFWGTWCALCGIEMPEIQKFFDKHSTDEDVSLVTINTDEDPEVARAYIAEKKFTFPVLIDDGYARRSKLEVFPTTWIVDPSGRKAFEIKGLTRSIDQEIETRIELLRHELDRGQ